MKVNKWKHIIIKASQINKFLSPNHSIFHIPGNVETRLTKLLTTGKTILDNNF